MILINPNQDQLVSTRTTLSQYCVFRGTGLRWQKTFSRLAHKNNCVALQSVRDCLGKARPLVNRAVQQGHHPFDILLFPKAQIKQNMLQTSMPLRDMLWQHPCSWECDWICGFCGAHVATGRGARYRKCNRAAHWLSFLSSVLEGHSCETVGTEGANTPLEQ